ncbi:MAG: squalene synthase HpnC [Bacteroidetes bacterium]|nr:squalene synthase HpnC [Bacteroidota bacterium]
MDIESAYNDALEFARNHYENFPVVSFLVPKNLRKHVAIIYWFARTADDLADEGPMKSEERIKKLDEFENRLTELLNGNYANPYELALHSTIEAKNLSADNFYNLLKAFKQDVIKKRYNDFSEVLDYCRYSANPVGRLILELNDIRDEKAFHYSDQVCTALQLTNFWQDTLNDFQKGRIYYPLDEMDKFGVMEKVFELKENNLNLKALVKYNVERTNQLFNEGKSLIKYLNGRLKYEIKWTILGGETILKKIELNNFDVLNLRPVATKKDFLILFVKSIL